MNSGGSSYSFLRTPGAYASKRPIRIDTQDIDVSATRFHRHRNHRVRSTSPEQPHKHGDKESSTDDTESVFMPRVDQNDPIPSRSTIKRDRNIVRLSTMRQRSQSHSNRNSRESIKKTANSDNGSLKKVHSQESTEELLSNECDTKLDEKKSWRDKFGDSLQTNFPKAARKTPGELILERHIIRDKNNSLKTPLEPKPTIVRIPDNVTPQEITYLEPLIRQSIRRQSLISCPSFKDICKDISSDIKDEDEDLNAGQLRRRASLILEQEGQIIVQLTSMRRPSADVTVDETIAEEPASDENEKEKPGTLAASENTGGSKSDIEKGDEKATKAPTSENVIVIKKQTKKKGGKLKHKITVTVEVDNSSDIQADSISETPTVSQPDTENSVGSKTSPTWRAVVEEIEEDVTINLPKKVPKKVTANPLKRAESGTDFWNLIGPRESVYVKKKVDLKRNEMEIVELVDENEQPESPAVVAVVEKSPTIGSRRSPSDEKAANSIRPKITTAKISENRQESAGNEMVEKKNMNYDKTKMSIDACEPVNPNASAAVEKEPPNKSESTLNNTEQNVNSTGINRMETDRGAAKTTNSPVNKMSCHEHKQTEKIDSKERTTIQASNLNLDSGLQANKETKTAELVKSTTTAATASATATVTPSTETETETETAIVTSSLAKKQITSSKCETSANNDKTKQPRSNDPNVPEPSEASSNINIKPKAKKNVKEVVDKNASNKTAGVKTSPTKKKVGKKQSPKLEAVSSVEKEINVESTDADKLAASESIALTETIEPKLSDHGNDNESELSKIDDVGASPSPLSLDAKCPFGKNDDDNNDDSSSSVGGLSKFATVANLNEAFEIDRKSSSIDLANDRTRNNKSTLSTRSIADSCISAGEQIDLLLDFLSDSDTYSDDDDSESEDEMGQKCRRPKKRKEKLNTRKVMKLDPKRKCYITDETAKYPLIATPRPLAKRSNYCGKDCTESESESETSSDICSSDECYDECLSPNDVVVKDVIRMSTCSNDSGFEGGGTAPSTPKKMLGKQR